MYWSFNVLLFVFFYVVRCLERCYDRRDTNPILSGSVIASPPLYWSRDAQHCRRLSGSSEGDPSVSLLQWRKQTGERGQRLQSLFGSQNLIQFWFFTQSSLFMHAMFLTSRKVGSFKRSYECFSVSIPPSFFFSFLVTCRPFSDVGIEAKPPGKSL